MIGHAHPSSVCGIHLNLLFVPREPPEGATDFNDLAQHRGLALQSGAQLRRIAPTHRQHLQGDREAVGLARGAIHDRHPADANLSADFI